ncbi:MAG: acyl-CoA hydrolase [Salibacteraceae bacterium]|jgi:acyl-CoA hydrolase
MERQKEAILNSETHVIKCVFPNTTNHYDTLFGRTAMQWMDEIAFITATRFSQQRMVTVSPDKVDFKKPILSETFAELIGEVAMVGFSNLKVRLDIFTEQMNEVHRELAVTAEFILVCNDENKKRIPIQLA